MVVLRTEYNEVKQMGLFDVFQKGGKYFGKDIKPHCEYCEFGKRAKDGNKVLCDKRGLVDADFHCGKFTYSPLKRIPVKQMNRVGFTDVDDEFIDTDEEETTHEKVEQPVKKEVAPLELPEEKPEPVAEPAPVAEAKPVEEVAPAPTAAPEVPAATAAPVIDEIAVPEVPVVAPAEEPAAAPVAVDEVSEEQKAADLAAEEALRALENMNL